ncbi:hypothetical protein [Streptomyces hirsutus]|uniref:hypothetical protein n=1 Tax=Streptomyces hirsutus TaxID=35620 RepID=UPI00368819FA
MTGTQPSPGGDELRARHYLHRLHVRPFGHQEPLPATPEALTPPTTSPQEHPMLLLVLCLAGLAPGIATAWLLRTRGWPIAVLAGIGVTISLPGLLIVSMIAFPPLGIAVALAAIAAALRAYDDGRVLIGSTWATTAVVALTCAGVAL